MDFVVYSKTVNLYTDASMSNRFAPLRRTGLALVRAFCAMMDHRMPRNAAAISYFSLFALFPSVLVILAVGNDILGFLGIRKNMLQAVTSLLPLSKSFLESNMPQMLSPSPALVLSCVLVMIWTSSWIFGLIENGLNRAWGVTGRRTFWQSRLRSIIVVALGGSILLSSAGLLAMVTSSHDSPTWYEHDPLITWFTRSVLLLAVLLLAILVFFCVYKLMPDRKVIWVEALSGAILAALLWESGSILFFKLVPFFDFERVYGRMGVIMTLMAWVYTSNLILLFGGNFSAQLHRPSSDEQPLAPGSKTQPNEVHQPAKKIRSFPRQM